MAKKRRSYSSNRRLPDSGRSSPYRTTTIPTWSVLYPILSDYIPTRLKYPSQIAPSQRVNKTSQKSHFPKTYSGFNKPESKRKISKPTNSPQIDVCQSRQNRKEVLHATGNAGKVGQKPPHWTTKSKIRC